MPETSVSAAPPVPSEAAAAAAQREADRLRQVWAREYGVELADWHDAHDRGERLLRVFASAAATVLADAAGEPPDAASAGGAGGGLIEGLVPAAVSAAADAERVAGSWQRVTECLTELAAVGETLEESATGLATAIQEIRTLTTAGDQLQAGQLADLEAQRLARETETQMKLTILGSLEGLLQPGGGYTEGSVARLLTRYSAAWSTLPYCGGGGAESDEEGGEEEEGGGGGTPAKQQQR